VSKEGKAALKALAILFRVLCMGVSLLSLVEWRPPPPPDPVARAASHARIQDAVDEARRSSSPDTLHSIVDDAKRDLR
jgi:hypothetical protein